MLEQAADGLDRDFNSIAATEAVPALLVLLVLSVVAGVVVARKRTERSALGWSVAFATVAPIVAATLFRGDVSLGFHPGGLTSWACGDLASLSRDPLAITGAGGNDLVASDTAWWRGESRNGEPPAGRQAGVPPSAMPAPSSV